MSYEVRVEEVPGCPKVALSVLVNGELCIKPKVIPKEYSWVASALTHAYARGQRDAMFEELLNNN